MFDFEIDLLNDGPVDRSLPELDPSMIDGSSDSSDLFRFVQYGVSCLQKFVQFNFVGPSPGGKDNEVKILEGLALSGEPAYKLIKFPEYLHVAKSIFIDQHGKLREKLPSTAWWTSRTCWIWQQLFVDRRAELRDLQFDQFKFLDVHFSSHPVSTDLTISYALEKGRIFGFYYEYEKAESILMEAFDLAGLNRIHLTGVLGRRTKFQVKDLPQLALEDLEDSEKIAGDETPPIPFPIDCALQDDTLLENTHFQSSISRKPLRPVQECALIVFLENLRLTHSSADETMQEIEKAYIDRLLHHPVTYVCKYVALFHRCRLESSNRRRVERALAQAEQLVKEYEGVSTSAHDRLRFFFTINFPPIWNVRKLESDLLISLGCTRDALRIFIDLELWDDAIDCYRKLGMLDRAETMVREQLEKMETPHLWCLLGDIIDDEACYSRAWTLSGNRLARAQSSLGTLYFVRKKYEEAVKAYETALAILPLDLKSWYALGYCAMQIKNYERAAQAYRRCTTIDSDNFEPWNNLAACYVHLGDKNRAFQILLESVKCNYENWKVWENYVILALDTGHFREVITGINRLIDLRGKYEDAEVLDILARVGMDEQNRADLDAQFLKDLRTLFGRVTAKVVGNAQIWRSYSKIHAPSDHSNLDDHEKYVSLLQKAHQTAVRSDSWTKNDQEIKAIVDFVSKLALAQLKLAELLDNSGSADRAKQVKASARLTLKGILANLASESDRELIRDSLTGLKQVLEKIEGS